VSAKQIEIVVPLAPERVRERIRAEADRHRYDPLSMSREAGSRTFIFSEPRGELVVHVRGWLPDFYGHEARITFEPVGQGATRLHAKLRIPLASRVIVGVGLVLFVGLPLVAFAISGGRDLGMLPFLGLPLGLFVVVPLAYRFYRRDDRQLVQFLEDLFPEAEP
jgi:hypothetical protein